MLYVDNPKIEYGRMKMCHMLADSSIELRRACIALALDPAYIEHVGKANEHININMAKRKLAIEKLGAKEVSSRQLVRIVQGRRS